MDGTTVEDQLLILTVSIFLWVGAWGAIDILITWLFEQLGSSYNPGIGFLIYFIIVLASLIIIRSLLIDQIEKENKNKNK
jgi:NhaP-type Na+/H+ and K+/H+ antiporter